MFQLPDTTIVSGDGYTVVGGMQYPLQRMSPAELTAIGVSRYDPPPPTYFDPTFYLSVGVPRAMADIRAALKGKVAAQRWGFTQLGTVTPPSIQGALVGLPWKGHITQTNDTSQTVYTGMVVQVQAGLRVENSIYKFVDGPFPLLNSDVILLAATVASFIQSLFTREAAISAQIDALPDAASAVAFTWSWTPPPTPASIPANLLSASAFRALFTDAELMSVMQVAKDNSAIAKFLSDVTASNTVDLTSNLIVNGMQLVTNVYPVVVSLARSTQILSGQPHL